MSSSILTYWSLIGGELGLVVSVGVVAARTALRRQEIRHCIEVQEYCSALSVIRTPALSLNDQLQLEHETQIAMADACAMSVAGGVDAAPDIPRKQREFAAHEAEWLRMATAEARRIAIDKGDVTADDVYPACPPVNGISGSLMRYVFATPEWEIAGKRRARSRNRDITVWRLRNGGAT